MLDKPTNIQGRSSAIDFDRGFREIIGLMQAYIANPDVDFLRRAFDYARRQHEQQKRRSGEPYFIHPVEVARLLTQFKLNENAIAAGLLHDTVEDTETTSDDLSTKFNDEVARMVDGVTKLSKINFKSNQDKLAENFRKMILAMSKDIRILLIKLADRLHNMRTLGHMRPAKQRLIAQETLDIYAPLANRLGIFWMKSELEDLCFRYLKSEAYYQLVKQVNQKKESRDQFIREVREVIISKIQSEYGSRLSLEVSGRSKHLYSIYKKMIHRDIEFDQVTDLFAFRCIVQSVSECYSVLGIVHELWRPVPGRFKDYIAMPKPNNYRSLHTTVIGPEGEQIEIQIRTREMDDVCEHGIAAHWAYKESRKKTDSSDLDAFRWLKQLLSMREEVADPGEFLDSIKVDLFENVIYCFTPRGDVYELPANATPIDFAFLVHTDVGLRCSGAKVNNRMVPLRTSLRSGDTIEIITSSNQRPSKDWINHVVTSKARNKIRSYLKTEDREKSRKFGREMFEKVISKRGLSFDSVMKSKEFSSILDKYGCNSSEDLFARVGYGKIQVKDFLPILIQEENVQRRIDEEQELLDRVVKKAAKSRDHSDIIVDGMDDILVRFGKCCHPLPGEEVSGFITRGHGITVHNRVCRWALATDQDRQVNVSWNPDKVPRHSISLRIITVDKQGILANITKAISVRNVNVTRADILATETGQGVLLFDINVASISQLQEVTTGIEGIAGVISVHRVFR